MRSQNFYVYILTNQRHTVLYIGITNDIARRLWEHGTGKSSNFTKRYNVEKLIYVETYSEPRAAIEREKQLKNWSRKKKEALIAQTNSEWRDLGKEMFGDWEAPREAASNLTPRGSSTSLRSARNDGSHRGVIPSGAEGPRDTSKNLTPH
jgi:putative endonuclease